MTTDQPTAAELWAQIDPGTLSVDQLLLYELNIAVSELRTDVRAERKGRRLSIVVISVAFVLAVFLGGLFATNVERDRNQACATRIESRDSIRAGIDGAVDEVAIYARIDEVERTELRKRAADRVYEELGQPDC